MSIFPLPYAACVFTSKWIDDKIRKFCLREHFCRLHYGVRKCTDWPNMYKLRFCLRNNNFESRRSTWINRTCEIVLLHFSWRRKRFDFFSTSQGYTPIASIPPVRLPASNFSHFRGSLFAPIEKGIRINSILYARWRLFSVMLKKVLWTPSKCCDCQWTLLTTKWNATTRVARCCCWNAVWSISQCYLRTTSSSAGVPYKLIEWAALLYLCRLVEVEFGSYACH